MVAVFSSVFISFASGKCSFVLLNVTASWDVFPEMGLEGGGDSKMLGLIVTPRHKRSKR